MSNNEPNKPKTSGTKASVDKKATTSLQGLTSRASGSFSQSRKPEDSSRESKIKSFNQHAVNKYAVSYQSNMKLMGKMSTGWSSHRAAYESTIARSARLPHSQAGSFANTPATTKESILAPAQNDPFKYACD